MFIWLLCLFIENLRKNSPLGFTIRGCTKQYQIPGTSVILKPGDLVSLPILTLHTDERSFPDPDKFDPERFSETNKTKIACGSYIPFGCGPRGCMGKSFFFKFLKIQRGNKIHETTFLLFSFGGQIEWCEIQYNKVFSLRKTGI